MANPTGRESDKFMLRLPDGMRDRIKKAAQRTGRSMNAEIVAALEEHFPEPTIMDLFYRYSDWAELIERLPSGPEKQEAIEEWERQTASLIQGMQDILNKIRD